MKRSLWSAVALAGTLAACNGSTSPTGSDATSLAGRDLAGQDSTSAGGQDSTSGGTTKPDSMDNGSAWIRVVGTLAHQAAAVPGTAKAGEPFSITVNTIGTTSCIKDAGTEVTVQDSVTRVVRVVAYDSVPAPDSDIVCAAVLSGVHHNTTVRFELSEEATVRVVGYMGFGAEKRLDSLDYKVTVGP